VLLQEAAARAMEQYSAYSNKEGIFSRPVPIKNATTLAPHAWWEQYGAQTCPDLQPIAMRITSLSATASGCEQNWSSFGYVHSDSRNRLSTKHATDLVWLYSNLRLAKRTQALEQQQQAQPWVQNVEEEEEIREGSSSGGDFSDDEGVETLPRGAQ